MLPPQDLLTPSALPFDEAALLLNPRDSVAIAKITLPPGTTLLGRDDIPTLILRHPIPWGHKIALKQISLGETVYRYGQVIGLATRPIQPGDYVHVHNLAIPEERQEFLPKEGNQPVKPLPEKERRTFQGYLRENGQVGTRNYIAVIPTVNCSAHVCREIAHHFTPEKLHDYPNVDGVIPISHSSGCGLGVGTPDYITLQRTLAGMARHPNVGASLLIGLGCEGNNPNDLADNCGLCSGPVSLPISPTIYTIQETGGIRKSIQAGMQAVEKVLPLVNAARRTSQPISGLKLALQCGGSDAWSGITANPLVGTVADHIVHQGGAVLLAETPEIFGAEHLLAQRAVNPEVAKRLLGAVRWWEDYTRRMELNIENNRSLGNAAGGLSTIYEKSLGAIAKGGSTPLTGVYEYAEPVTAPGLGFMNTPGYDPVSVTGQVAGGCNLVLFTTGRGSVFGFKPAPSIKISTNSQTYWRMSDDMDVNAGRLLEGKNIQTIADELLELVIAVASGQPSKSEAQGVGEAEFIPWLVGGIT